MPSTKLEQDNHKIRRRLATLIGGLVIAGYTGGDEMCAICLAAVDYTGAMGEAMGRRRFCGK